jgi:quercetin dioxygenase-like cupin family protein
MRHFTLPLDQRKGWLAGPWESNLPAAIGYASAGIDEPHLHPDLTEIDLVARGSSRLRVGRDTIQLGPGSVVVVEPGEPHTFLDSSPEYMHFVVHVGLHGDGASKLGVARSELGL